MGKFWLENFGSEIKNWDDIRLFNNILKRENIKVMIKRVRKIKVEIINHNNVLLNGIRFEFNNNEMYYVKLLENIHKTYKIYSIYLIGRCEEHLVFIEDNFKNNLEFSLSIAISERNDEIKMI